MKFGLERRINLKNIDPVFGDNEQETIVISEAFSFDEARQKMATLEAETINYYKGVAAGKKQTNMFESPRIPESTAGPVNVPQTYTQPSKEVSGPPAEFNVD